MPPRQVPPMTGFLRRGMSHPNPFMMNRPNAIPPRHFPFNQPFSRGVGVNPPSRGLGGLLSRITGNQGPSNPGGGGLLSRLFGTGSGGAPSAASGFEGIRTGSVLQSAAQPGGIMNFLNQTQAVIQTASRFQPLIEQYGPLVRNLPAMWKLYRSLKADDKEETNADDEEKTKADGQAKEESPEAKGTPEENNSSKQANTPANRSSQPKQKATRPKQPKQKATRSKQTKTSLTSTKQIKKPLNSSKQKPKAANGKKPSASPKPKLYV